MHTFPSHPGGEGNRIGPSLREKGQGGITGLQGRVELVRFGEAIMVAYQKLGRKSGPRRALLRSQVTALLKEERIEVTESKARAIRPLAEKMITLAKRGDLHARRQVASFVFDEDVVKKLFDKTAPRMEVRDGGYTRMVSIGPRKGDGAPMVILELVK